MPWISLGEQLDRLNGEFNRMYGKATREIDSAFPAFNIHSNAEGAILTAELPGVDIADLDITVAGNVISVKGTRKEGSAEDGKHLRRERKVGEFVRSFEMPFTIEADKVEARSNNGVLKVVVPRSEADKPKRIEVKTA
jgi:Molecular chaperone (small heat shock protein)